MTFGGTIRITPITIKDFLSVAIFITVLLFSPERVLSKQIIIDSDDQFRFAYEYMEKGEYLRAVREFERLIYFFPQDKNVPRAHYLMGFCYLKGKEYESARKVLEHVYKTYSQRPIAGKALFLIGESYYIQGISDEAEHYFQKVIEGDLRSEYKDAALYRLGWSLMKENRWREASEIFNRVGKTSPLYDHSLDLSEKSLLGEELPRKNPTAAGVMSGIVPGLGHAYCKRYKDGIVAFLLNGIFIWAAIESFDQGNNVLGGILLFLEVGWYTGNIYSAVNSAHKYNRKVRNDFRKSITDRLDLDLFITRHNHLGIALSVRF
jgi:tetratricopeptide (TPR) repeat protein